MRREALRRPPAARWAARSRGRPDTDVLVVGDVFCDILIRGIDRLPDWGEEVFGTEPVLCPGGVANVAVGMARLGLSTHLLARTLAQDTIGAVLAEELAAQDNLEVTWLGQGPSTALTVALPQGSERAMVSYEPPADGRPLAPVIPWDDLGRSSHLHIGSWNEGASLMDDQREIAESARAQHLTTSLDVSLQTELGWPATVRGLLSHVDVFMPNRAEACHIAETDDPMEALDLLSELVPTVVVKLGADGAVGRSHGVFAAAEGLPTTVVDTTGAGDAFAAGFLHGFVRRWDLSKSLSLANICGSLSVARIGSSISVPSRREAFTLLEQQRTARPSAV